MSIVGRDMIETYQRDGVAVIRNLIDNATVERLRDLAEWDMSQPGPMQLELARDGGRFYGNTFLWPRHDGFRDIVFNSPAAEAAAAVMESRSANILFDQFLIKEPNTQQRTRWHHDLTYWPVIGDKVCTVWVALDDVTAETGAVEYVRGSHRWGQRFKAVAFVDDGLYKEDLPAVPDIDAMRGELDIVQYELSPGDCTIHHGLTVHGAPGNSRSDRRRRAYQMRWAGDDVVYHPRPGIQPMLWEPKLRAGDPVDCDLWPRVWPRPGDPVQPGSLERRARLPAAGD